MKEFTTQLGLRFQVCICLVLLTFVGCEDKEVKEEEEDQAKLFQYAVTIFLNSDARLDNSTIDGYLTVLELLDNGEVAKAKKRLQESMYIKIGKDPEWEFVTDKSIKNRRMRLLRRIRQYHEKHKDDVDMNLPSNRAAVERLQNLD